MQLFTILSALLITAYSVFGSPAIVQSAYDNPNSSSEKRTISTAFTSNNTAGNMLVAVVGCLPSGTIPTVTVSDGTNGSYTKAELIQTAGIGSIGIFYFPNCAGGVKPTVTASFSVPAQYVTLDVIEVSGCAASSPVDVGNTATGNSGSSSVSVTTSNATDILIGGIYSWNTVTAGQTLINGFSTAFISQYLNETSPGTYSLTGTQSSTHWLDAAVAFKSSSSPKPTPSPSPTPPPQAVASGMTKLRFDEECKSALDIGYGTDGHKWNAGMWYQAVPPTSDFSLNNGVLTITDPNGVNLCTQYHDASGGTYFTGGYFEAYMLCNDWSAFWLYCAAAPTHSTIASNPLTWNNELDIIESDGGYPNVATTTIHKNTNGNGGVPDLQNTNNVNTISNPPLIGQWHIFGLLWTQSQVTWYVDNVQVCTAPTYASTWQPVQLILGVGPGGVLGSASTVLPPVVQIKWVRVWQQ